MRKKNLRKWATLCFLAITLYWVVFLYYNIGKQLPHLDHHETSMLTATATSTTTTKLETLPNKPRYDTIPTVSPRDGTDVYKFFDAGSAYHDLNMSCPVAWEWTRDKEQADVIWTNVLEHRGKASSIVAYPGQLTAFMSLESAQYVF